MAAMVFSLSSTPYLPDPCAVETKASSYAHGISGRGQILTDLYSPPDPDINDAVATTSPAAAAPAGGAADGDGNDDGDSFGRPPTSSNENTSTPTSSLASDTSPSGTQSRRSPQPPSAMRAVGLLSPPSALGTPACRPLHVPRNSCDDEDGSILVCSPVSAGSSGGSTPQLLSVRQQPRDLGPSLDRQVSLPAGCSRGPGFALGPRGPTGATPSASRRMYPHQNNWPQDPLKGRCPPVNKPMFVVKGPNGSGHSALDKATPATTAPDCFAPAQKFRHQALTHSRTTYYHQGHVGGSHASASGGHYDPTSVHARAVKRHSPGSSNARQLPPGANHWGNGCPSGAQPLGAWRPEPRREMHGGLPLMASGGDRRVGGGCLAYHVAGGDLLTAAPKQHPSLPSERLLDAGGRTQPQGQDGTGHGGSELAAHLRSASIASLEPWENGTGGAQELQGPKCQHQAGMRRGPRADSVRGRSSREGGASSGTSSQSNVSGGNKVRTGNTVRITGSDATSGSNMGSSTSKTGRSDKRDLCSNSSSSNRSSSVHSIGGRSVHRGRQATPCATTYHGSKLTPDPISHRAPQPLGTPSLQIQSKTLKSATREDPEGGCDNRTSYTHKLNGLRRQSSVPKEWQLCAQGLKAGEINGPATSKAGEGSKKMAKSAVLNNAPEATKSRAVHFNEVVSVRKIGMLQS